MVLLVLLFFDRIFIEFAEPSLKPWFWVCRIVTPDVWEVRGNALLGLGWLFSGVVIYSMLTGAIFVLSAVGIENFVNQKKRQ